MDLWYPPKDRPQLFEWWRPLILASRAARLGASPWPIHVDELILRGRIDRGSRPAIWVYANPVSGGELYLDSTGQAYRFTKTASGPSLGRFSPCPIEAAIVAARLPEAVEEQQARAAHPAARGAAPGAAGLVADAAEAGGDVDVPPLERAAPAPEPRRRGHLVVHEGGRQLAG